MDVLDQATFQNNRLAIALRDQTGSHPFETAFGHLGLRWQPRFWQCFAVALQALQAQRLQQTAKAQETKVWGWVARTIFQGQGTVL